METRWVRRLGPGVAAMAAVAAVAATTTGAPPPVWQPPACAGPPAVVGLPEGTWFRLDAALVDGTFVGQVLSLGLAGTPVQRRVELPAESFASGPSGGTVLIGRDDGRTSELTLIDVAAGCGRWVGSSRDVLRNGIVTTDGRALVETRVDRRTRADLGVWRRSLDGGVPVPLLPPLGSDARFGPTWRTDLAWSADGGTLVVGSCGQSACRYRLVPPDGAPPTSVADPTLGSLVGLSEGRLIVRAACRGLPCPIVAVTLADRASVTLEEAAGIAVLTRDDDGRSVVVSETGPDGAALRSVRPDGSDRRALPAPPAGLRLVGDVGWSGSALEDDSGRLLFGPDGRLPLDGPRGALLRDIHGTSTMPLEGFIR